MDDVYSGRRWPDRISKMCRVSDKELFEINNVGNEQYID
jgi:hypothetical protein